jgi:proteasome accessory factor C
MRPGADKHLERLLVMVPWISSQDGPKVSDVCARFDINERDLAADMEMLFLCGLYPFTPDALIEADIDDGRVWIRYADTFNRPPALTPEEAVGLVAAASAVIALPGNEQNQPLRSALQKLSNVLGLGDEEAVDVDLTKVPSELLEEIRRAVEQNRNIELDYYSYGRDVWNRRAVQPYRLFSSEGQWYLQAFAVEALEIRNFRVDRMRNLTITETKFTPPADLPPPRVYEARNTDPVVVLELESEAKWVSEQYPMDSVSALENGLVRVEMRVSERAWLERLLLRLGGHARVVKGDVDVSGSANRILRRYS